jgi:malonate-semialdehyde dehydrogenase (acetylating)/methylmalonate-semialdehyde dehydrogenase
MSGTAGTYVKSVSFFLNGAWEKPSGRRTRPVLNPATGEVLAEVPMAAVEDVDRAVATAHEAYLQWRDVPVVDRVQVLYRYKALLESHQSDLAQVLTSENGKTLDDARAEVRRGIQMVEVACGMPSLMMGDALNDVAAGIDCKTVRQPIGVCAGITPFNFPAMVPMWMFPFAIACGNAFILKPSEQVPLTPSLAVDLLHEAGLPAGVLNLIHGDKTAVDALLAHPLVKAVSFVGSTPVARYIYATAAAEGKRVQALGGAKNHLVVMPDADMDRAAEAIIGSAFGAAGERCLAGSVLVAVGEAGDVIVRRLMRRVREMRVGDGSLAGVEMGPLISSEHATRVARYIQRGISEGAVALCDGRTLRPEQGGFFLGPTIFDHATPQMSIANDEIFGPVLTVIRAETLEEAIRIVNRSPYGNASSIFTSSGAAAREYSSRVEAGMVGINVGVAAPMAFFPFAGWKQSFFGDLHAHGKDAVAFYTEQKVIISRW